MLSVSLNSRFDVMLADGSIACFRHPVVREDWRTSASVSVGVLAQGASLCHDASMSASPHDPSFEEVSGVEVQNEAPAIDAGMYCARCGTGPPRETSGAVGSMSESPTSDLAPPYVLIALLAFAGLFTVGLLVLALLF